MTSSRAWGEALLAEGEAILRLLEAPQVDLESLQVHLGQRGVLLQQGPGLEVEPLEPALVEALKEQDAVLLAAVRRRKNLEGQQLKKLEALSREAVAPPRYVDRHR